MATSQKDSSLSKLFYCLTPYNEYILRRASEDKINCYSKTISTMISSLERMDRSIIGIVYKNGDQIDEMLNVYSSIHYSKYTRNVIKFDIYKALRVCSNMNDIIDGIRGMYSLSMSDDNYSVPVIVLENFDEFLNPQLAGNLGTVILKNICDIKNVKLILTGTQAGFDKAQKDYPYIYNNIKLVNTPSISKIDTLRMLNNDLPHIKHMYGVSKCPVNMCQFIVDASDKYVKAKVFPGKAYDLMNDVLSMIKYSKIKLDGSMMAEYKSLLDRLDKERALYIKCSASDEIQRQTIEKNIDTLSSKVEKIEHDLFNKNTSIEITSREMIECVADILDIESSTLTDDKLTLLRTLEPNIMKKVKGQDDAVNKLVASIKRSKLGLNKKMKTIGNFFFIGPSGVGKTELAKTLARELYGSEDKLIRLDMSEFSAEIDVSKLLGSAPGYIGYGTSGLLINKLKNSSGGVILFDEIEKAHDKIMDTLLQLLDEGFITSSTGEKVYCNNYVIIFTSNIGVKDSKNIIKQVGFNVDASSMTKKEEDVIMKAFRNKFKPEFINRLDQVCFFDDLDFDTMEQIFDNEFNECISGTKDIIPNCMISITPDAKKYIIEKAVEEKMGARPLYRLIQNEVCTKLADHILDDSVTIGDMIEIDYNDTSSLYIKQGVGIG